MKKILFLLFGLACLTACSDDVVESISSQSTRMNTEMLYLTVKIIDVGSLTRAEDGGYKNGTEAEYKVENAYFYFYDEDGLFVSRAEVWGDGNETTQDGTNPVEFEGNTVVVLKGLTNVGYPKYMVTVLNLPDGFEDGDYSDYYDPAGTLEEMQTKLASDETVGINDESGNFVMSTSSYQAQTETDRPYYFVTEIPDEAFQEEPIGSTTAVPVEVYVERLAAKVEVGVSENISPTATTITDEYGEAHTVFLVQDSVIGMPNQQTTSTGASVENIYIEFLGWALNATARQSYIVKNIKSTTEWTNSESGTLGFVWNVPTDFRSFWGMSPNYDDETIVYPTESNGNIDADENGTGSNTPLNEYLKYTSLEDGNLLPFTLDETEGTYNYTYCAENTNTPEILGNSNSSAITSVLLKARAWQVNNVEGEDVASPITLIRYMNDLYTEEAFLNAIAVDLVQYGEDLPYYYSTYDEEEDETTYTLFNGDFLEIIDQRNGSIGVVADTTAIEANSWYTYTYSEVDEEYEYTLVEASTVLTNIASACGSFNAYWSLTGAGGIINEYADGLMYYNIPIEHLNNDVAAEGADYPILEANYGVVRNHWYSLTINSLSHLGTGIVNEREVIVPTNDDTNYIRAEISILPWKLIENTVIF